MADERDFELLDDYLTNRLSEGDRIAFERRLTADPDLRNEFSLQQRLVDGIREARRAELKSMLNRVEIPAADTGNSLSTKIALGTAATLIAGAAAYWFLRDEAIPVETKSSPAQEEIVTEQSSTETEPSAKVQRPGTATDDQVSPDVQPQVETDKNQTSAGTEHSKPSLAKKPEPLSAPTGPSAISPSSVAVEVEASDSRYSFHYQFENEKLRLFGPFEKGQYKVIELASSEKRLLFLAYRDRYYALAKEQGEVRALIPVEDPNLLQRLQSQ